MFTPLIPLFVCLDVYGYVTWNTIGTIILQTVLGTSIGNHLGARTCVLLASPQTILLFISVLWSEICLVCVCVCEFQALLWRPSLCCLPWSASTLQITPISGSVARTRDLLQSITMKNAAMTKWRWTATVAEPLQATVVVVVMLMVLVTCWIRGGGHPIMHSSLRVLVCVAPLFLAPFFFDTCSFLPNNNNNKKKRNLGSHSVAKGFQKHKLSPVDGRMVVVGKRDRVVLCIAAASNSFKV